MLTTLATATAGEGNTGWGRPLALIGSALLFWLVSSAHKRWKEVKGKPFPTSGAKSIGPAKQRPAIGTGPDGGSGEGAPSLPASGGTTGPAEPVPHQASA